MPDKAMDTEIYIGEQHAAPDRSLYTSTFQTVEGDLTKPTTRAVRKLAHWKDPLTIPHSRSECVKWCHITPWDKWCCGWKLQWQWMYCDIYLEVITSTPQDIIDSIEDCIRQATIASALAAIVAAVVTGGGALAAAETTFVSVITPCLEKKLKNIVSIRVYQACGWGPWE